MKYWLESFVTSELNYLRLLIELFMPRDYDNLMVWAGFAPYKEMAMCQMKCPDSKNKKPSEYPY